MVMKKFIHTSILMFAFTFAAVGVGAAEIKGFRTAKFGDSESAIKTAIKKDFQIQDSAITTKSDQQTGVTVLEIALPIFEPLDLPAKVTYTMGYKCKCLMQVAINWNASGIATDPAKFLNRLGVLHNYLQRLGWDEKQVMRNKLLGEPKDGQDGAVLFFRGETSSQAAVSLLGVGVKVAVSKEKNADVNLDNIKNIILVYDRSVQNPDVYSIEAGKF